VIVVLVNRREDLAGAGATRVLAQRLEAHDEVRVVALVELGLDATGRVMAGDVALEPGSRVLVRTNPARDMALQDNYLGLEMLGLARERGVVVMNEPTALSRASTKLYLSTLPERVRPRALVSRDASQLTRFIREAGGRTVLKPVLGTRGRDVFLLHPEAENLPQILDIVCRSGLATVQDFVPEAVEGDSRIVVLGGRVLRVNGHLCAVRRVPSDRDFRSNVAVGGHPAPAVLSQEVLDMADEVAAHLLAGGIHFAGLDVIGSKIIEANVFATGGLEDAGKFAGEDFFEPVIEYFLSMTV